MALSRRNSLFSLTMSGAESSVMIQTLIETARANGADPYYYLKYLMEQMPKYLYEKGRKYMSEMMPLSEKYRRYEIRERLNAPMAQAPPGNEKPKTPTKRKRDSQSA